MDRRLFMEWTKAASATKSAPTPVSDPVEVTRTWLEYAESSAKKVAGIESLWFEEDDNYLSLTGTVGTSNGKRDVERILHNFLERHLDKAFVYGSAKYDSLDVMWDRDNPDATYTAEDEKAGVGVEGEYRLCQNYNYYIRWDKKAITADTVKDLPDRDWD